MGVRIQRLIRKQEILVLIRYKEVRGALAAHGIIKIYGDVDGSMVNDVVTQLSIARANDVTELDIRIQSNGGNVRAGLDIYDELRAFPAKRCGLVVGYARSMGAIMLQACEERRAMRHARILIHYVARDEVSLSHLKDPERLALMVKEAEREQSYINAILHRRTGKSIEEIQEACGRDIDMMTDEAKDFGLIDEIID
ncbi:MAG: ATP-dependent Clp protease proteolytic subunit [Patescibacteria group bacterium]|nr:ATP-dependent Clp protease proteolytic subunit [Patescibacteria group bacterium]MDE1944215.1 ATP-dependent Clp protease proteolytic subunit [Patescibacteria group bacterium]MDE1945490.1 ATP-dependent Clp protease proteolytic subunit [Patescibacteria group bacterium]MDE2058099.1 ATP-dependent Clp protease proteolytic subunit [Patescibacteria group bacterium]